MENQKGKIQLITIIVILFFIIVALLVAIIYLKLTEDSNIGIESPSNVTATSEIQNTTNTLQNTIDDGQVTQISKLTEFDLNFAKIENNKQNMIYSPLSIKYALKMLEEGANGNTYTQINNLVGNMNLPKYKNIDKTLSLANSVFIRDTYYPSVKEEFKNILFSKYNAEILQDNFANASNSNQWIEQKTFGIINNILSDEQVIQAQMLLVNALAIDMEWESEFSFIDTHGEIFYKVDGTEMTATMISKETSSEDVSYYVDDNIMAIEMDLKQYEDNQLEFMAIKPNEDLQQYVNKLTYNKINEIDNNLKLASSTTGGLIINIPKFKYDYSLKLKDDLIKLGMTDLFNSISADFSKIVDQGIFDERLYVSDALHKADVDFSEKGIKVAAVTVFDMMESSVAVQNQPISINFNKPFLFIIRDKATKDIWFVGTVYEPNYWDNDKDQYQK